MNLETIKKKIAKIISDTVQVEIDSSWFETPKQKEHGDIAFPCFRLAKNLKKAPPVIAEELISKCFSSPEEIGLEKVAAVSGYLNFTIEKSLAIASMLKNVLEAGAEFGTSTLGNDKKVIIEFSSVNIAKPFGIGHLRSTIIGATLTRAFTKLGYKTISINHLGDWGTQFGRLITAYKLWGREYDFSEHPMQDLYQLYVRFHNEVEGNAELEEQGREEFRKIEAGDQENLKLWKLFQEYSMKDFNRIYNILGVEFDYLTGESFYQDKMSAIIEELEKKKLLSISKGATIVDLTDYDLPPCLIKKTDDATLYATRDLAALLYRKAEFNFDKLIYVVGSAQKLHFQQLFKVAELMGKEWIDEVAHVDFGWVKFGDKAMSTRSGTLILLDEVFNKAFEYAQEIVKRENSNIDKVDWTAEKVAVAAIIFTQLKVKRTRDVNFIWADALSFKGETGPYLQYTHARLTSLINKFSGLLPDLNADFGLLGDEEKNVIMYFEQYPQVINNMVATYETSVLTDYLLSLTSAFNSYWQQVRIITEEEKLTSARMQMAYAVRLILADGLKILGIEPLERM